MKAVLFFLWLGLMLASFRLCFWALGRPGEERPRHWLLRAGVILGVLVLLVGGIGALVVWSVQPGEDEIRRQQARSSLDEAGWDIVAESGIYITASSPKHMTAAEAEQLSRLGSPGALFISAPEFDDDMLQTLADGGALNNTHVLNLNGTGVSDEAVPTLLDMPQLTHLSLERTRITEVGVSRLIVASSLEKLALSETPATDEGVELFRRLRPDVEVVWQTAPPLTPPDPLESPAPGRRAAP